MSATIASRPLRIATRKSQLALWQAEHVAALLRRAHPGLEVELVPMSTKGDRIQDRSLAAIGGKGLFIKELEAALEERRADLAVHSMKDVPGELPEGLMIAAVLPRADARDALVTRSPRLEDMRAMRSRMPLVAWRSYRAARLGTSSLEASGAVVGGAAGPAHRTAARQCGYAPAASRCRRVGRDHARLCGPYAPGARIAHRGAPRARASCCPR